MWPLAMAHLLNSKLSPSTASWKTASIAEFTSNDDAVMESTQARRVYPSARRIALPRAKPWSGPSIWSCLRRRRTVRAFSKKPVGRKALATLLREAAGVTGEMELPGARLVQKLRAWPSAGGLYPVELYPLVLDEGAYHFDPVEAALEVLVEGPVRERVAPHVFGELGPLLVVLTGVPERTMVKYGERGYRLLLLDVGHLSQNLLLAAEGLGLAACPIGFK
jgi:SagB-type dehydrogenase family enzyme